MELYEANRILRTVKAALAADGYKLPSSAETDGLMMLLGKLDVEKYLAPKIKHARTLAPSSTAYGRMCKYLSFFRALQAATVGISDPVTSVSVILLNKALCGDLDENAGKPRLGEAITDGNAHTDPKYIQGSLKSIIAKMNEIVGSPQTGKDDFAGYLSHFMRELIILRPFESGSEFTVRIFIMLFCTLKGFSLSYYREPPSALKAAEQAAFVDDDITPMFRLLSECLSYEQKTVITKPAAPRTRREIARDLTRPPRPTPMRNDASATGGAPDKPKNTAKPNGLSEDEILKRAIRLQQKISKLNEQLTELIQPLDGKQ